MNSGDPLQAETTGARTDAAAASVTANETAEKASVKPEDKTAESAAPAEVASEDAAADTSVSNDNEAESLDDDAWMDACRTETDDTAKAPNDDDDTTQNDKAAASDDAASEKTLIDRMEHLSDSIVALSSDLETLRRRVDDSENEAALTDFSNRLAAIEKTGDDAMSKFGHAIGVIAERIDDLEDRGMEYAAEMASPSKSRDSDVAPYIANAERELEESKSSGPVDIFDRIAQAAESQFDESRGSTAKRVSELIDDRRVGTKRWTPSKTMRQRMEKLEAARAAVEQAEPAAKPASAPTSSTATMVTPNAEKKAVAEPEASAPEEERIVISRRDRQPEVEEKIETSSTGATDSVAEEEEDVDELRVIPGARGRRRDRARKSRLDEDFEKIFDDDDKPSIGSLRRKMRTGAADADAEAGAEGEAADEDTDAPVAAATVTEEEFGAPSAAAAPKVGLFSRLFKSRSKTAVTVEAVETEPTKSVEAATVEDEETLVAAFEADNKTLSDKLDFDDSETTEDSDWEKVGENERKQNQIMMPIIGSAIVIGLIGLGYFAYQMYMGR